MKSGERAEAHISKNNAILVVLDKISDHSLVNDFYGDTLIIDRLSPQNTLNAAGKRVYLCGDISMSGDLVLGAPSSVFIIGELSYNVSHSVPSWSIVGLGQVPIQVHGMGVYYRRFFDVSSNYFSRICEEHAFQPLTESTKPAAAHRKGIYLTPIEHDSDGLHFRLLRCSTNLGGSTENFRATDRHIVDALNLEADTLFEGHFSLNHVLAQVYHNTSATNKQKQTKAKISSHADKTKDMPTDGIMAFCTFYDQLEKLDPLGQDGFDFGYKKTSGLTQLRFCLKAPLKESSDASFPHEFTITLYPGSVFFMPLSTNRLYTHEIKPSTLDAGKLPTRLGYVVRCSNAEAVHSEGHTFLKVAGSLTPLEPPTEEGMDQLRALYAQENKTDGFIDYGNNFLFSMNGGDYMAPQYKPEDEFRQYTLSLGGKPFEDLAESIRFEDVGKGRRGAVLVNCDEGAGVPIVRTTTRYIKPAHHFMAGHIKLAQEIKTAASLALDFNNALIECYTDRYASMGFHSDQALDLEDDTCIALFSCYKHPELKASRTLIVESKYSDGNIFEIPLHHNSVVVFSLATNRRFKHKIVLSNSENNSGNEWLGITFRHSKTYIKQSEGRACFEGGAPLLMATEEERGQFYPLRSRENREKDFRYPKIGYTLSESDMMLPE